jgi:hypothetical protein
MAVNVHRRSRHVRAFVRPKRRVRKRPIFCQTLKSETGVGSRWSAFHRPASNSGQSANGPFPAVGGEVVLRRLLGSHDCHANV